MRVDRASFRYRWRSAGAALCGAATGLALARAGARPGAAALMGWDVSAVLFLVPTYWILLLDPPEKVRARAGREDENRAIIMSLILCAVGASLAAMVIALREAGGRGPHANHHPFWILGLSAATLVLSWLVVQSLFALHYAHRYFGDRDNDGTADEGLKFPGDPPQSYRDFLYVAICIGATCQVSDFNVTTTRFRNLVTAHALIAFVFNTMVLALGINIFGNLMGQ